MVVQRFQNENSVKLWAGSISFFLIGFADYFQNYNNNEENLPVDQHELLALIAPRPLYVASAEEDQWADPHGEFLSAFYATPVYNLYGKQGIPTEEMPEVNHPIQNTVLIISEPVYMMLLISTGNNILSGQKSS